jgi:hypothetical protein
MPNDRKHLRNSSGLDSCCSFLEISLLNKYFNLLLRILEKSQDVGKLHPRNKGQGYTELITDLQFLVEQARLSKKRIRGSVCPRMPACLRRHRSREIRIHSFRHEIEESQTRLCWDASDSHKISNFDRFGFKQSQNWNWPIVACFRRRIRNKIRVIRVPASSHRARPAATIAAPPL